MAANLILAGQRAILITVTGAKIEKNFLQSCTNLIALLQFPIALLNYFNLSQDFKLLLPSHMHFSTCNNK